MWGKRERQVCCLLLHPSVLKVQVEPYSLRSACVCEEGGRKKGRAGRKKGVERWKGRDGRGRVAGKEGRGALGDLS